VEKSHRKGKILIFVGLIIIVFGAINYYRIRILSFAKVPATAIGSTTNIDIPSEISIPSINVDLKIDPSNIYDGVWQISKENASFLTTSSPIGGNGNTVIYGHNKKKIFGNLPNVNIGEKISVKTVMGKTYDYIVDKKEFVSPKEVELISETAEPTLTIYTYYGFLGSQRAVIVAKPI